MLRALLAMMTGTVITVAIASIAGCAPIAAVSTTSTTLQPTPLQRAIAAYFRVRSKAVEAQPYLPAKLAQQVSESIAAGDDAVALAQAEAGSAEQLSALTKLADEVATIVAAVARR